MTWQNGRQLATFTQGDTNISYKYDSNSVRTSKTVNGVEYTYTYLNGKLMYETRGNSKFYYSYDANGTLYSVNYTLTDSSTMQTYYYTHNAQGDIIGIYDSTGTLVATYTYGDWGNVVSITDANGTTITDSNHIANLNPFRYRSYYYDSETGFYYLMTRYYDPVTHRFINADGYFQAGGGILDVNMSAYCGNNSINRFDPSGCCYYANGVWTHDAWENLGGYEKKTDPKAIDITDKLNNTMMKNSQEMFIVKTIYSNTHLTRFYDDITFVNNVKPNGDWDFKSQEYWNLSPDKTYKYKNMLLRFDDIGNIHYGFVGSILYTPATLLQAGGIVQIATGTSSINYWDSNFDDPRDQEMIKIGIYLYYNYKFNSLI